MLEDQTAGRQGAGSLTPVSYHRPAVLTDFRLFSWPKKPGPSGCEGVCHHDL